MRDIPIFGINTPQISQVWFNHDNQMPKTTDDKEYTVCKGFYRNTSYFIHNESHGRERSRSGLRYAY